MLLYKRAKPNLLYKKKFLNKSRTLMIEIIYYKSLNETI